jgi:hypothetical protein
VLVQPALGTSALKAGEATTGTSLRAGRSRSEEGRMSAPISASVRANFSAKMTPLTNRNGGPVQVRRLG